MTTENTFCILLRPDIESSGTLRLMHEKLLTEFPSLVSSAPVDNALPYHMTIIGGIKIDRLCSAAYIKIVRQKIKVFTDDSKIPRLAGIESIHLPGYSLGIRLKFVPESYVITGSKEENVLLANMLGAKNFDFDQPKHITLFSVKNYYVGIDSVLPVLKDLLLMYHGKLLEMTFMPEIWEKVNGSWSKYKT